MVVKYCKSCNGKPYTKDLQLTICPYCGSPLLSEFADDISLMSRPMLDSKANLFGGDVFDLDNAFENMPADSDFAALDNQSGGASDLSVFPDPANGHPVSQSPSSTLMDAALNPNNTNAQPTQPIGNIIYGKVSQYSSSGKEDGNYRRLFIQKLVDAVIYRQRLEDVLHRFTVRVDNGFDAFGNMNYLDVPVNVHGTIASGMQLTDNSEVEVKGKYRNGVLMAEKIHIINNGYKSQIKFQRSVSAIVYTFLSIVAAILLIYVNVTADGRFFDNVKYFLATWGIVFAVSTGLYFILRFSRLGLLARLTTSRPRRFPFFSLLLFSLIITMLFLNSFGIGASLGALLSQVFTALLPIAIVIIVIIVLLKLIFK